MSISISTNDGHGRTRAELDSIVQEYRQRGDVPHLLARLSAFAAAAPTSALVEAVEPYREMHEVAGPLFEAVVEREPHNGRALVALANAYWLTGRGPEVVASLASRAIAADPANRGAWHMWALSESSPRERMNHWQQVTVRFPSDELAKANLADNAAAVAGAENDPVALKLAIATYESLLASAEHPSQVAALERALTALRNWSA